MGTFAMIPLIDKLASQPPRPFDVVGLGECSLDHVYALPGRLRDSVGGKCTARSAATLGGGQVATALCAASRLGWRTAFLGAIGDDEAGAAVRAGLLAEGVCAKELHVASGAATRTAVLLIDADGERTVIERRDPALALPDAYPPAAAVAAGRIVHVDATFPAAAVRAARLAKQHGALLSIDLDVPGGAAAELVELADLCVVPAGFATAFTGLADLDRASLGLAEKTAGQVIVTAGAAGALAVAPGRTVRRFSALAPPGGIVDTTACGDTFRAALLACLLELAAAPALPGDILGAALRFASAAAGLKCQGRGRTGCPTRTALAEVIDQMQPVTYR